MSDLPPLPCETWPSDEPCCETWQIDLSCCCDFLPQDHPDWTPQREALQQAALTWAEAFIDTRTRGAYRRCRHRHTICLPPCPRPACDTCQPVEQIELPYWKVDKIEAIFDANGNNITATTPHTLTPPNILTATQPFPTRTITIDTLVGIPPTPELLAAVAELACQRIRQCLGLSCDLTFDTAKIGRIRRSPSGRRDIVATGVPLVDMFLMDFALSTASGWGDPTIAARML